MTYLPSLIRKIEEFCRLSEDFRTINRFAAPNPWDDPNFGMESEESPDEEVMASVPYFDDLVNMSRQVEDPELSQQLEVLAELYRYSLQMGGGYATIARAINNLKNMYSDGSESGIEDILNGMTKELAKAAGGIKQLSANDNPSFINRLAQLKQDIESRNQSGRSDAIDAYNEQIGGQDQGAQTGESEEDLAQAGLTPEQAEIINPAALGFDNKDDPKTKKGWHTVGSGRPYKNWKEYYENERLSYEADLAHEQNPDVEKTLRELINLLPQLADKTQEALNLSNAIRSDIADPNLLAQEKARLDVMRSELQKIKQVRQLLRNRIRSFQLGKERQKLLDEKQELTEKAKSPRDIAAKRELAVVNYKLLLNELSNSTDVFKAKKRNYLLEMVRQMSGGAWPSQEWIDKQQQKIDGAKTVRKEDYDRIQTEERARSHGRIGDIGTKIPGQRGGGMMGEKQQQPMRKENLYDVKAATFEGLVDKLGEKVNTAAHVARLNVTQYSQVVDKKKVKLHNELKPLVEAISKTIQNASKLREKLKTETNDAKRQQLQQAWTNENQARYAAVRKLNDTIKADLARWAEREVPAKGLEKNVRWIPHFVKAKDALEKIATWKKDGSWNLTSDQRNNIAQAIVSIGRLIQRYDTFYGGAAKKRGAAPLEISLDSAAQYIRLVLSVLKKETLDQAEAPAEEVISSAKNRMIQLKQLLKGA